MLIHVKLGSTITGITVPHLVRFLRRYYRGLSKDALIRRVHRALDRLETEGLVNNKISEEEESYYNELGMRLMKKYSRYKRKNKGYRGPVNWITQLKRKEEIVEVNGKKKRRVYWEFANPPPDYLKYLEERMEKRLKEGGEEGFKIDWHGGLADYVKKYLIKNLKEILEEGLRNAGLIGDGGEKSGEGMRSLSLESYGKGWGRSLGLLWRVLRMRKGKKR